MFSRFVRMSTLFGISIQHFFFTSSSSSKQYSVLPFHFSKFDENPFYFLLFWHFPFLLLLFFFFLNSFFFLLLWILTQTTTLKQTEQIPSWNTMDKGFKKKRKVSKKKIIKRVLIKFWEIKWKEGILLWRRRRGEKKIVEWKFQKELTFRQILKTLLIIHLYPFLFHSLCFYPTLRPNKVLIWSWRLCSSDIDMTKKKKVWYKYFWHPLMRLLVHSWLSVFHVIYMWGVWFCLHYSTHIYCWECYTPFQSDFIC